MCSRSDWKNTEAIGQGKISKHNNRDERVFRINKERARLPTSTRISRSSIHKAKQGEKRRGGKEGYEARSSSSSWRRRRRHRKGGATKDRVQLLYMQNWRHLENADPGVSIHRPQAKNTPAVSYFTLLATESRISDLATLFGAYPNSTLTTLRSLPAPYIR